MARLGKQILAVALLIVVGVGFVTATPTGKSMTEDTVCDVQGETNETEFNETVKDNDTVEETGRSVDVSDGIVVEAEELVELAGNHIVCEDGANATNGTTEPVTPVSTPEPIAREPADDPTPAD